MRLLRDSSPIPEALRDAVIAIGNFDGVHLGHRAILREAVRKAQERGTSAGVLTFEPHPRRVFKPDSPRMRIIPFTVKMQLMEELGIDFIRVIRFTRAFSEVSATGFIDLYLKQQLGAHHLVVGEDFIFGHQRGGNVATLRDNGMQVTACEAVMIEGKRFASTLVREALTAGDMAQAATLLGRPYSITGRVGHGDKRGRQIGFATANIAMEHLFTPATGVYAAWVVVDGQKQKAAVNIGKRPTFHGAPIRLEAHLLDWQGDLYGKRIEVQLIKYLRPEQKFSGLEEITQQIARDCADIRTFLK